MQPQHIPVLHYAPVKLLNLSSFEPSMAPRRRHLCQRRSLGLARTATAARVLTSFKDNQR